MIELIIAVATLLYTIFVISTLQWYKKKKDKTREDINQRMKIIDTIPYAVGTLVAIGAVYLFLIPIRDKSDMEEGIFYYVALLSIGGAFIYPFFFAISHKLRSFANPIYSTEIVKDLETFCLYLRPFEADKKSRKVDDQILRCAKELCMPYAIGNPNAMLQSCDADRIYATDAEWKDTVLLMMRKCKFILLHVGQTDGFLWELQTCQINDCIDKSMFLVTSQADYVFLTSHIPQIASALNNCNLNMETQPCLIFKNTRTGGWYVSVLNDTQKVKIAFRTFVFERNELGKLSTTQAWRRENSTSLKKRASGNPFKFDIKTAFFAFFFCGMAFFPYIQSHQLKKKFFIREYFGWVIINIILTIILSLIAVTTRMNWISIIIYFLPIPLYIYLFIFWGRAKANSWFARSWSCKSVMVKSHNRILRQAAWIFWFGVFLYVGVFFLKDFETQPEYEYTSIYEYEDSLYETEESTEDIVDEPTEHKFYSDDGSCSIILDDDYENLPPAEEGKIMSFYSTTEEAVKPIVLLYIQDADECRKYGITSPKLYAEGICEALKEEDSTFRKISEKKLNHGVCVEIKRSGIYQQSHFFLHNGVFYQLMLLGELEDKESLKEQMKDIAATFTFED